MYDLIIIGSGPAGLSAAVYAKRAMLDVLVLEREPFSGGQIVKTEKVDNYLGMCGVSGYDMAMTFRAHADSLDVQFQEGDVVKIEDRENKRAVFLSDGSELLSRAVLIATGAGHKKLNVPGEDKFAGAGISYCATCDGAFYRNREVLVVGGGDVALEDALYLSRMCSRVWLAHRRDAFRAARFLQEQVRHTENIEFLPFFEVEEIRGEESVQAVVLVQNQTGQKKELSAAGVFIAVGMVPQAAFAKDVVETDAAGYIAAGEDGRTSVCGIFAAGDVRTKGLRQIATAVSDGANAVHAIEQYLGEEGN